MKVFLNNYYSLLAAFSMYTRLPAWRLANLGEEHYAKAIWFLPVVGILTGGVMAVTFYFSHFLGLPTMSAVIIALVSRLLLTGAFHEDGLGDFFDGFGGGREQESILRIMKDSHIGSYAVIGYICYYALLFNLLVALPVNYIPLVLLSSDVFAKNLNQLQIYFLSYARPVEESKSKVVYKSVNPISFITLPVISVIMFNIGLSWLIGLPVLVALILIRYVYTRIGGYTGDTCGALILITELTTILSFYLAL